MPVDPVAIEALAVMLGAFAKCDNLYGETELRTFAQSATALRELLAENAGLAEQVYVPDIFKCAKCGFVLMQSSRNPETGAITSRNHPGQKCPNDGSPLWRVSYRDFAHEQGELAEASTLRHIEELTQARADLAATTRTLEACRAQFDFYAQEHRKSEKHEKAATNERFAFMITQALLGGHKEQGDG